MRILAALYAYPPMRWAGADIFNEALLKALAAAGHEVDVFTTQGGLEPYERDDVRVFPGMRPTIGRRAMTDVVITAPDAGGLGNRIALQAQAPVVGVVHNVGHRNRSEIRRRRWNLLVWNSEATKEAFSATYSGDSMVVIPPVPEPVSCEHSVGVTLVNVSRDKGSDVFWELARRLPDVPFHGVLSWGPQAIAHPRGEWVGNVRFLPTVPHKMMRTVWEMTQVLLVPSVTEAWGMAAVEALAHGVRVVAHPTPGLRESLGAAATFVDRDDLHGWEQAVLDALHEGPQPSRARPHLERLRHRNEVQMAAWVEAITAMA